MITLTAATYNHLGGGIDNGSYDRLAAQLDMIAPLELDVLFSTEAKHWFDDGRRGLWLAASRLGMQPLWVRAPRHDCNLVIFIRVPRIQVLEERHESGHPWWHAQARAVVTIDRYPGPVWLAAAHFAPFNPDIRLAEARATCDLGDRPAILGGDLNDEGIGDAPTDWSALPAYKALRHLGARRADRRRDPRPGRVHRRRRRGVPGPGRPAADCWLPAGAGALRPDLPVPGTARRSRRVRGHPR